jgi:hypothetical protein
MSQFTNSKLGKELNYICTATFSGSIANTIQVTTVMRHHNCKTSRELKTEIDKHKNTTCQCGCTTKYTLREMGENFYQRLLKYTKDNPKTITGQKWEEFTEQHCIDYIEELYTAKTLRGVGMEDIFFEEAIKRIKGAYSIRKSTPEEDKMYNVDFILMKRDIAILGIQIKADTFLNFTSRDYYTNNYKNLENSFNLPVIYAYYCRKNEKFDFEHIFSSINNMIKSNQ